MELHIIRHGQSYNNALMDRQHLRVHDPPLTVVGKKQADCLADYLRTQVNTEALARLSVDDPARNEVKPRRFTHLYCSAMHRALQTAQPIGKALNMTPEVWVDIHEHGGIFLEENGVVRGYPGKRRSEILEEFPDYILPETVTEDGWWKPDAGQESYELAAARAMLVARQLKDRAAAPESRQDKVAIVVHGTFIDLLLKSLLDNLPGNGYFHWHYNTAMTRIDFLDSGTMMLRYINRIEHLPLELMT